MKERENERMKEQENERMKKTEIGNKGTKEQQRKHQ
jgi:hypothetical protein